MANTTPSAPMLPGTLGQNLAYWFRNSRIDGQIRGAGYILADGSTFAIDLTVWANRTPPSGAVGFVLECPGGRDTGAWWMAEVWSALLGQILRGVGDTPAAAVANAAANVAQREAEERAVRDDAVAHLARELDRHDWWACMSDNYGAEVAANRHMQEVILPLLAAVPQDGVRSLWQKHAPWQFPCPV